jgi:hypothetical protein
MVNEKTPNVKAANAQAVGPKKDELIGKFKEQSIPLEADFKSLIEIADVGRKAAGLSLDQTDNTPGNGMAVTGDGKLEVKAKTNAGINVDVDGVSVKLKDLAGLTVDGSGLAVKRGAGWDFSPNNGDVDINVAEDGGLERPSVCGSAISIKPSGDGGIKVDRSGVGIKLYDKHGLVVDGNGLAVSLGAGLGFDKDGKLKVNVVKDGGVVRGEDSGSSLCLQVNTSRGLYVDAEGVALKSGAGWDFASNGDLDIKVDPNGGLVCKREYASAISIKPAVDGGIKVDGSGVSVNLSSKGFIRALADLIIPKGTVVPFFNAGAEVPEGWALCNGDNGTPKLCTGGDTNEWALVMANTDRTAMYHDWKLGAGDITVKSVVIRHIMKV